VIEPRGLSPEKAAEYCGCETLSAFYDWVARGIIPGPIPGTRRWDRKAIDATLDKASGIAPDSPADKAASAFDQWRADQCASS
jgi:hypothetical protein